MGGALVVVLIGAGVAHKNSTTNVAATAPATASASAPASPAANVVKNCTTPEATRSNNIKYQNPPTDTAKSTAIVLATNCGKITISLDAKAPKTSSIMSFLAQNKFFDATKCHRLTTSGIFVLQCGDPAGDGTGSPGFSFADENLPAGTNGSYTYPRGTVAMANSGPNTNGSQFFLVYKDSPLPPNYSVWGTVSAGLDVIDAIAGAGTADGSGDGAPKQPVTITTATAQ